MKTKIFLIFSTLWLCIWGGMRAQTYISSETELREFAASVNSGTSYQGQEIYLTADIIMGDEAWIPIGTDGCPFRGTFEGWGHKICNLVVDNDGKDYAGLFGYINGGSVRDVGVEGSSISGGNYIGGICGYLGGDGGEISSCYSMIMVSGVAYLGGICGYSTGKIENCWHEGNIIGTSEEDVNAGGLVGYAKDAVLRCCYLKNTVVSVPNVANYATNSFFGIIVGQWITGYDGYDDNNLKHLDCCIYEKESVCVADFDAGDVIVGSQPEEESPSLKATVKDATTDEMTSTPPYDEFWTGILNTEKNNLVWVIKKGSYPQLNSFCKNQDLAFHFTKTKPWLSIVPNGNYTDLKGIKAYIVKTADKDANTITLQQVTTLNEGCAALVYYETDVYEGEDIILFHTTDVGLANYEGNLLKGSHVSPVSFVGDGTEYILKSGAFVPATSGNLARNKAYLKVPLEASGGMRYDFLIEEVIPTDIKSVDNKQLTVGRWCTLEGRYLDSAPTESGVYIYEGRKVAIQ